MLLNLSHHLKEVFLGNPEIQISEKTKEMHALKDEMEKKKALFEEVEANMIRKSREIQKVRDELEVQEEKLAEVSTDK
jgi:predicted  nucleic acid-binding Zn-ribbon protein